MDAPAAPVAVFKKRGAKAKANIRKRAATPPPADSDSSDYSSSEDEAGQRIKRRRKDKSGNVTTSTKTSAAADADLGATVFKADRSVPITDSNDATKRSNWFDAEDMDSLSTKNLLGTTRSAQQQEPPDGKYKGLANKPSFIQKNPDAPSRTVGPVKAPTNIRTITITDFAPDVCKDYKQTGFCGFGDNCKYLHAREDYKAGWQLDKEWETVTKGKKNLGGTVVASRDKSNAAAAEEDDDEEDALLESIPFACIICKEPYKQPIKTRCGHYFCEPCALKRYRKDPTCAACGSGTNGVFNGARQLQKLLDKKRERAAKRRQAAIEAGEEVSDEEEEE
ncbi:RNA-splicing factor [Pyricularia oryzae]|uniref:Pre-mRNA-splicing factor CWC24 n=2 Tax=Pyricularia TaxID=48558 RepID=A0ABQ8NCS3_PYRGI|nr:RNA-splicing factor [Pyricularia oryzae]KAI6294965.1 RNA-splicing factor [Pyricularia grisea]KAI6272741.1 RNA-splicing factor [Pyricularia oryzae]KAI6273627.1 RNA-splicing factor [Pyricularia oryzae]KAI6312029.1 RNA-splicing factor [Pyricularia oryzae]